MPAAAANSGSATRPEQSAAATQRPAAGRFWRRFVQFALLAATLALIARTWLVSGVVDPLVVESGSMAPALLGPHRHVRCHDCGYAFDCDERSLPTGLVAACPNCGADNDLERLAPLAGDRLLVDRAAYAWSKPRRGDIVVLPAADNPGSLSVKRVAGLPGERVEIRAGDLYVDGQLVRKPLADLLAVAADVHDAACRPNDPAAERWQPTGPASGWRAVPGGYECAAANDWQWLEYEHRQTHVHRPAAECVGPILDDLAYNAGESRELVPVPDVILICRLAAQGAGLLRLRADDGRRRFELELDLASGVGTVSSDGQQVESFAAGSHPLDRPAEVILALADAQLQLSLAGRLLVEHAYDPSGLDFRPTARPLAVGCVGSRVSVSELRVLRDLYYLPAGRFLAAGGAETAACQLGSDEYWLLGDNSAQSLDSRQASAVSGNLLLGKALVRRGRGGR